jgi:hypothetical protein
MQTRKISLDFSMNNKIKFVITGIGAKQLNSCIDNIIKIDPKYIKAVSQNRDLE